jgi:hypothetical protein
VLKSGALALHWQSIRNNFYGRFPFPIESLYWLGILLGWPLDVAPKVINSVFVLACALLVYSMLRQKAGREGGWLGAALVLTHPVMREVSLDAYIDAPAAFLVAASVCAALILPVAELPLVGLLFGIALSVKYTILQLYLLPFATMLVVSRARDWWNVPGKARVLVFMKLAGALPLLIWLGKNVYLYGNPLEPFFNWLFRPGNHAAVAAEQFYILSHYPQPFWTTGYWLSLLPRLREFSWILLPLALASPLLLQHADYCKESPAHSQMRSWQLLLFIGLSYLLWNLVRESQARFLLPLMLLVIYLAVDSIHRLPHALARHVAISALLLFTAVQLFHQSLTVASAGEFPYLRDFDPTVDHFSLLRGARSEVADGSARADFYSRNLGAIGEVLPTCNALPENSKVLLVYEARPYLFAPQVTYNTVWDESELLRLCGDARTTAAVADRLQAAGITHVLVNRQELRRYIQQYARPEQLAALGIRASQDPGDAFFATGTPEDLFPPFYRDARWPAAREAVIEYLANARKRAAAISGKAGLDIYLSPIR